MNISKSTINISEEKEIINDILNKIVEEVENSNKSVVNTSKSSPLPFKGRPPRGPPPRGPPPRGNPPRGPPLPPNKYLLMKNELYLDENEIKDEIIIKVPKKYDNYVITELGHKLLLDFLSNIHKLREQNLSLRGITLNKIKILEIRERIYTKNFNLHLNLGLNPYIYFNDYYISNINSISLERPIIILKRYLKYNPIRRNNLITIKYPTNLDLMLNNFTPEGILIIKKKLYEKYETEDLVRILNFMIEDLKEEEMKQVFNCRKNDYILNDKFEVGWDIEHPQYHNLTIWKYGREILKEKIYMLGPISSVVAGYRFEWFKKKIKREYELTKNIPNPDHMYNLQYAVIWNDEKTLRLKEIENNRSPISYDQFLTIDKTCESILLQQDYYNIKKRIINKLGILKDTVSCNEYLKNVFFEYVDDIQNYLLYGNDLYIRKYLKDKNLFDEIYDNETLYQELLNDSCFKLLDESLEKYNEEIINNDKFELQTPDIYILLGFHDFHNKFSKELWALNDFSKENKWYLLISSLNFLESTIWYYMYALCCCFAQLIGPSYYIYNYYIIEENKYCPNNSSTLNKFFAIAYYLVLYARMNSFWRSLTTTCYQYGETTLMTNNNYLRLSLIINSLCLVIIPLFTYTLFIEMSNVTDLILNCLTGEFLINIDNLIIEFLGEEDYIKSVTKELLVLSFIKKGFPNKNIMDGNTIELWLVTLLQVLQMFGTLIMTGFVFNCI